MSVATTWQWNFHLTSITTPDGTGLWIPSSILRLLHQINWFYAPNLTDLQKGKTASYEMWLLSVLQKKFPKKFTKKYLCYILFLILLKCFRSLGLQLYWRDTPTLVFQNQPFVDLLQNRGSWIIQKIHRKTLMFELHF